MKLLIIFTLSCLAAASVLKVTTKVQWKNNLLQIKINQMNITKLLKIQTRSAAWFSNIRCSMSKVDINDTDILKISELRIGFEDYGIVRHKIMISKNMTYAISNFNANKIYFFEFPSDYKNYTEIPTYIWSHTRPQYLVNSGRTTKPEIMACLHLFKLAGFADQQVGLNSFGQPKKNKEAYTSIENYKLWVKSFNSTLGERKINDASLRKIDDSEDPINTTSHAIWYYILLAILIIIGLIVGVFRYLHISLINYLKKLLRRNRDDSETKFAYDTILYEDAKELNEVKSRRYSPFNVYPSFKSSKSSTQYSSSTPFSTSRIYQETTSFSDPVYDTPKANRK